VSLFLVPTPIGNLGDITLRAIETLREADLVIAEDTRRTRALLSHLGITGKKLISLFAEKERTQAAAILRQVAGKNAALTTDAGSPALSDPGAVLVREALAMGIPVVPLPGATALVPAVTASGLDSARFLFYGFPPRAAGERRKLLTELAPLPFTLVFYETAPRVIPFLREALATLGERECVIAREISKAHESFVRGTLAEMGTLLPEENRRGEVVALIAGASGKAAATAHAWTSWDELATHLVEAGLVRKNELKRLLLERRRG